MNIKIQYCSNTEYTSGVVEVTTVIQQKCGCIHVHVDVYPGSSPHSGKSSILQLFLCDLSPLQCPEMFFQSDGKLHECSQVEMVQ